MPANGQSYSLPSFLLEKKMKITNDELKQIIKEELNNVLQEFNPLMALPFMGRKGKEQPTPQRKGLGRPRNAPIKGPKPAPPMRQHPDTPKMPASSIEVDLGGIYSQVKAAADATKESPEDQAMVYQDWLTGELQNLGHSADDAYDVMSQLEDEGLISFDEESGRVSFER
jgi:hypothetical protein